MRRPPTREDELALRLVGTADRRSTGAWKRARLAPSRRPGRSRRAVRRRVVAARPAPLAVSPGWLLTDARGDAGVHDRLRREAALTGAIDAHPSWTSPWWSWFSGFPPELSFDPRFDRPLVRRAMRGLLPERVRLRRHKVHFTALVLDALTATDRDTVDATLSKRELELGAVANTDAVRRAWEGGSERH